MWSTIDPSHHNLGGSGAQAQGALSCDCHTISLQSTGVGLCRCLWIFDCQWHQDHTRKSSTDIKISEVQTGKSACEEAKKKSGQCSTAGRSLLEWNQLVRKRSIDTNKPSFTDTTSAMHENNPHGSERKARVFASCRTGHFGGCSRGSC